MKVDKWKILSCEKVHPLLKERPGKFFVVVVSCFFKSYRCCQLFLYVSIRKVVVRYPFSFRAVNELHRN